MKRYTFHIIPLSVLVVGLMTAGAFAQSLTDKLEEEETFYKNYGKETYAKLKIERDVVGLYDFFGEHIVDGIRLYELSNQATKLSNKDIGDSTLTSQSTEHQKRDFYEKFSNLVVTQDAIGGVKTSFLIGDQIVTKFTPLTFNKVNFRGIRWDLWSSGLQLSFAASRTRPGWVSTREGDGTGTSLVEYPITEQSFPGSYYNDGIRGSKDFSSKSPFGDYDFLWALHGENTIANKVDVGLTFINHHVNDIKRGPSIFKGQLPDSLMPEHIHFEFYDMTPEDTLDAGVYVENVTMYVNDKPVEPKPLYANVFRRTFAGDRDDILLPRDLPLARPQTGDIPVIVEFKMDPKYWQYSGSGGDAGALKNIKKVKFKYTVAGNYMVFVSSDRQTPLSIDGEYNPQTRRIDYSHPRRSVGDIYDDGLKIGQSGNTAGAALARYYSATYWGEYIAQAPRRIAVRLSDLAKAVEDRAFNSSASRDKYNYRSYEWDYNLNVGSVTFGANFKGEIAGVKFSGEANLNQSQDMLPGSESSRITTNRFAGTLKAERDIGKHFNIDGEVYYVAPQWSTNLENLSASRYFSKTTYKNPDTSAHGIADYQVYPRPLDHSWQNVDDNDDNDPFPEGDRRHYPADLNASDDRGRFADDGTLKWQDTLKSVNLPGFTPRHNMEIAYDDPDGVVASKSDKNKNGVPDYTEDFLLFASDPPVFELGIDLDNNGIPDVEEDDILPDFGHRVGYVITGDGIKTQGIRGLSLNLRWTPFDNTTVDGGTILETVLDKGISYGTSGYSDDKSVDDKNNDGSSKTLYLTAKRQVIKRSQGIQYDLGLEVRAIWDALRNDAVRTNVSRQGVGENLNVSYEYYIDPLDYRHAFVENLIGTVAYTNIPNFEYGAKLKLGSEQHTAGEDSVFKPFYFGNQWTKENRRLVLGLDFVNKVGYTIKMKKEYEDWRSVFNFLNRLEVVPQFKFGLDLRNERIDYGAGYEAARDPRNIRKNRSYDVNGDGDVNELDYQLGIEPDSVMAVMYDWFQYSMNNYALLLCVPILKMNYKIAENTTLQLGAEGARVFDFVSPENDAFKLTTLAQVVTKAQYKGYSVTFYLGARWYNNLYDVNARDPVLGNGSLYDTRGYLFFAKLYSGV